MSAPATKEAAAAEGNPIGGILKKTGETIADAVHHGIEGLASTDETAHIAPPSTQGPIAKGIVGLADMTPGVDPNAPGPIKQMHEAVDSAVETLSSMDQSGPNPDPTM